jgi:hypothetical protein
MLGVWFDLMVEYPFHVFKYEPTGRRTVLRITLDLLSSSAGCSIFLGNACVEALTNVDEHIRRKFGASVHVDSLPVHPFFFEDFGRIISKELLYRSLRFFPLLVQGLFLLLCLRIV